MLGCVLGYTVVVTANSSISCSQFIAVYFTVSPEQKLQSPVGGRNNFSLYSIYKVLVNVSFTVSFIISHFDMIRHCSSCLDEHIMAGKLMNQLISHYLPLFMKADNTLNLNHYAT